LLKKNINDANADVRNNTLIAIGSIKGRTNLGKLLDDIPPAKLSKINEVAGTGSETPSSATPTKPTRKTLAVEEQKTATKTLGKKSPSVMEEEKKEKVVDAPKPPTQRTGSSGRTNASSADPGPEEAMTLEEASSKVEAALPSEVISGLG
jgi:hypothetical protein